MSKFLIIIGVFLILIGIFWPFFKKIGLGDLPGDIFIKRGDFIFYFPFITCFLISALITFILWLFK